GLRSRTARGDLSRCVLERRAYPFRRSSLLDIELEQGRQTGDQRIPVGPVATEEPADHLRALAATAMMNREQTAVFRRTDDGAARHWRQTKIAAHQMQVVARQQNHLAGPNHEVACRLAIQPNAELAVDDIVINNQVSSWADSRPTMLRRDPRRHAPWREEIGVQKYTAGQMRHPQDVG